MTISYGDMPAHLRKAASTPEGKMIRIMARAIAPTMAEYVSAEIAKAVLPLITEIAELKARRTLSYEGVWQQREYHRGAIVTHSGSAWHCNRNTTQKPGASSDWVLMVKKKEYSR